ncbi:hypothetical protein GCM10020367_52050 [Streptomyces sannanensis]|uniref:Uncharacterized protein n=1 Tax=Streptomyces sannanensis TaxID=285536 RepID=A0ABP6SII2_9ACTN
MEGTQGQLLSPGPPNGHCLPIDPVYLSWWASQTRGRGSRLIDLAAHITSARPAYVVHRVAQCLAGSFAVRLIRCSFWPSSIVAGRTNTLGRRPTTTSKIKPWRQSAGRREQGRLPGQGCVTSH